MNDGRLPSGKGQPLSAGDEMIFKFECKRVAEQRNNIITAVNRSLNIRSIFGEKLKKDRENCDFLFQNISRKIDIATDYSSDLFQNNVLILFNEISVLIQCAFIFLESLRFENRKIDEESMSLLSESISTLNKSKEKLSKIKQQNRSQVSWTDTLPRV